METTAPAIAPEGTVVGRMLNVLAAPGGVYAGLKDRQVRHSNWLVPALVWFVISSISTIVLFSQPWAEAGLRNTHKNDLNRRLAAGEITAEDATEEQRFLDKHFGLVAKLTWVVLALVMAFAAPFVWGFAIWLIGTRFLDGDFEYIKGVEAAGLVSIIYTVASVLGVLVAFTVGRLTYVSPAFFLGEMDFNNKQHLALAALNPLYLWYAALIAFATARLSGASFGKAAALIFAFWLLLRVLLIMAPGLGFFLV